MCLLVTLLYFPREYIANTKNKPFAVRKQEQKDQKVYITYYFVFDALSDIKLNLLMTSINVLRDWLINVIM